MAEYHAASPAEQGAMMSDLYSMMLDRIAEGHRSRGYTEGYNKGIRKGRDEIITIIEGLDLPWSDKLAAVLRREMKAYL